MNIVKTILLAGAAYMFSREENSSKIEDLEKRISQLIAENFQAEDAMQQLRDEYEGDLKGRLECFLTVRASRISWWGDYWNSGFQLMVKNIGTQPITISAIRVFWTVDSQTSILSPWTTSAYTIQPDTSKTITLYGFKNKNHFKTIQEIKDIEQQFKDSGENKTTKEYNRRLTVVADADFVQSVNGRNMYRSLKNIPGIMIGMIDGRIFDPHRFENGTEIKSINDVKNPSSENEK